MFKTKSLKSRILLYSSILIVLLIITITSIFYITERNRLIDERSHVIKLEVEREVVFIEREFSKLYENTQSLSFTIYNHIEDNDEGNRDNLLRLSEKLIENNPNIIGINLIFQKNIIENDIDYIGDNRFQSDGQFITYISKEFNTLDIRYLEDYDTYEVYQKSLEQNNSFFTEPYIFTVQGEEKYISTVVFPIYENGIFLGTVGIDFTSEYIFEQMELLESTYQRRDIIVSQEGTILLNTSNPSSFNNHISTIHPKYEENIVARDLSESYFGIMPNGNYEVVSTIDLGSTGDFWYIFSDLEQSVVLGDLNTVLTSTIFVSVIIMIIGIVILYIINSKVIEPIIDLANAVKDYTPESSNIDQLNINTKNLNEIHILRERFKNTLLVIEKNLEKNRQDMSIQSKQITLQKALEGAKDLETLTHILVEDYTNLTEAIIGALYIRQDNKVFLKAKSGLKASDLYEKDIRQGLIMKVFESKEPLIIHYPTETEHWVDFGLDLKTPPYIYYFPLLDNSVIIGVLQLVSLEPLSVISEKFIKESAFFVVSSIIKQENIKKSQILLKETQVLADELDQKQQDLEVQNEELETQQEELRVTNEELEAQQEELRVTNNELQENIEQMALINKELENTRKELEKRTRTAEESNKFKSDFLANMSHELRTPLNSILILSNLISEEKHVPDKMKEFADTIHSSGKDLLELINGILDLSKVESGKEEVKIDIWAIKESLNELEKRFKPLAKKHGVDFRIHTPNNLNTLMTDGAKVRIILTNFLSNAIKFTHKGSVTLNVSTFDKEVIFDVIDTGIGIDQDKLNYIFEEFHQIESDSRRSYGGTGLGLSICKKYAMLLNGRIEVESEKGKGSTFRLILPKTTSIKNIENKSDTDQSASRKNTQEENILPDDRYLIKTGKPVLLIIDDNLDFLTSMYNYFKDTEISVILSNTGENGLFLADYYLPTAIIVDEHLPKISGREVIKKLNKNPRTSDARKYIISGKEQEIVVKDIDFISKPIEDSDLKALVKEILELPKQKSKVLLIEDDPNHRRAVTEYLNSQANKIELAIKTVGSKKEAIEALQKIQYDLLVIDLGLEDTSGTNFIEEIRQMRAYEKTPVIVYTGKEFIKEEEEKLAKIVQDIIIKGDQSPLRLLNDIQMFMSQKDKQHLLTDRKILSGKTVLIVDDDIRNIFSLTGLLESYNINVLFNTSGKEAIERLANQEHVDLVLMDIMMPEMNGYETMNKIREKLALKNLPIIALTAKSMRGDRQKCINAGADEYLSKPLDKDKLLSVLRVWLS